jgi:hypothetical protein
MAPFPLPAVEGLPRKTIFSHVFRNQVRRAKMLFDALNDQRFDGGQA